jgi:hypothetical protein
MSFPNGFRIEEYFLKHNLIFGINISYINNFLQKPVRGRERVGYMPGPLCSGAPISQDYIHYTQIIVSLNWLSM